MLCPFAGTGAPLVRHARRIGWLAVVERRDVVRRAAEFGRRRTARGAPSI
jgi:hypothetical protein